MGLDAADQQLVDAAAAEVGENPRTAPATESELRRGPAKPPANSGTVGPNPCGYCSVAATGRPRIVAPSISRRMFHTTRAWSPMAGTSFSCTSTTSKAVSPADINSGLRGRIGSSGLLWLIRGRIAEGRRYGQGPVGTVPIFGAGTTRSVVATKMGLSPLPALEQAGKKARPRRDIARAGASSAFRCLVALAASRKDSLAYQAVATAGVWLWTNC